MERTLQTGTDRTGKVITMMKREDVRVVLSSADGTTEYLRATVTRTLSREIETILEQNDVFIETPQDTKPAKEVDTYA